MKFDFMSYNDPYFVGEDDLTPGEIILETEADNGTYFVRKSNIDGIFTYGFKQNEADYHGNPVGYIWSSRAGVMNKLFGTTLIEVVYKKQTSCCPKACAMDARCLEKLLEGTEYMVDFTPHETATDIRYRVLKRS